jgi:hypothetical protein
MIFKIRCIGFTSWRSKFLGFTRSTLASHNCSTDSIPWVHHSREEGSLDYDGRLVSLQVYLKFNTIIHRQLWHPAELTSTWSSPSARPGRSPLRSGAGAHRWPGARGRLRTGARRWTRRSSPQSKGGKDGGGATVSRSLVVFSPNPNPRSPWSSVAVVAGVASRPWDPSPRVRFDSLSPRRWRAGEPTAAPRG